MREIENLKQRGGRTLSIVDLIRANTISIEAAAYVGEAIGRGASYLTAAVPGGAGKTALLAALLGFLPEGMPIETVMDASVFAGPTPINGIRCFVAHEIGQATIPGYLWGGSVAPYLELARSRHMVVSCLHADTMEELTTILTSPPLSVPMKSLAAVRFTLFMHVESLDGTHRGVRHRVAAIHDSSEGAGAVWVWDRHSDRHIPATEGMLNESAAKLAILLNELAERDVVEYSEVRRAILEHWQKE